MRIRQEGEGHAEFGVAQEERLRIQLSEANLTSAKNKTKKATTNNSNNTITVVPPPGPGLSRSEYKPENNSVISNKASNLNASNSVQAAISKPIKVDEKIEANEIKDSKINIVIAGKPTSKLRQKFDDMKDSSNKISLTYPDLPSSGDMTTSSGTEINGLQFKSSFLEKHKLIESNEKKGRRPPQPEPHVEPKGQEKISGEDLTAQNIPRFTSEVSTDRDQSSTYRMTDKISATSPHPSTTSMVPKRDRKPATPDQRKGPRYNYDSESDDDDSDDGEDEDNDNHEVDTNETEDNDLDTEKRELPLRNKSRLIQSKVNDIIKRQTSPKNILIDSPPLPAALSDESTATDATLTLSPVPILELKPSLNGNSSNSNRSNEDDGSREGTQPNRLLQTDFNNGNDDITSSDSWSVIAGNNYLSSSNVNYGFDDENLNDDFGGGTFLHAIHEEEGEEEDDDDNEVITQIRALREHAKVLVGSGSQCIYEQLFLVINLIDLSFHPLFR